MRASDVGWAARFLLAVVVLGGGCTVILNLDREYVLAREEPDAGDGGGPIDPGCAPSATEAPADDTCGVFVSSAGDDANAGTKKDEPVKTLAKALQLAVDSGGLVYLCAEAFEEPTGATVPAGIVKI